MNIWEQIVVHLLLGAGTTFWLWYIVWENDQRRLEVNEQQNWWQHQDDEMEMNDDRHE